jgi:hypothetical protein
MNIELRIERVVLDLDLRPAERERVRVALEQRLAAMVRASGLRPDLLAGGAVPSLPAPAVTVAPGGAGAVLGAQIATSLGGALTAPAGGGS